MTENTQPTSTASPEGTPTVSATGGAKGTKRARFDLIPAGAMETVATHFGNGALKYADHNWRRGYAWSSAYAAMQRHLHAFWGGEDFDTDPTTGEVSPHLAAVAFYSLVLLTFMDEQREYDDRFAPDETKAFTPAREPAEEPAAEPVQESVTAPAATAPDSHLPDDMNQAIEHVAGDADYSIYVLDGQRAATTGNQDDWHDALLLIDLHSLDASGAPDGPVVKFTRNPEGLITFYYPLADKSPLYQVKVAEDTTGTPAITILDTGRGPL